MLSLSKIGSLFSIRQVFSEPKIDKKIQPQPKWDTTTKAAIVILWGLLIYPQLDPDLTQKDTPSISFSKFIQFFMEYLNDEKECVEILYILKDYDYVRFHKREITPGTGLFTHVDALKMYQVFHSSVLARKLFQQI